MRTSEDILTYFKNWDLDEESRRYVRYECRRYEFLFKLVEEVIYKIQDSIKKEPLKILDIGPAYQTEIMRRNLKAIVNTLGFEDSRFKPRSGEKHFQFDLNDSQYPERCPKLEEHHLIVMGEVLEHLYTSPKLVLKCISTWLRSGGYLIIQTPNAAALYKRPFMLIGKNPYEMIRETRTNPGHFRELTLEELISVGRELGFTFVHSSVRSYFGNPKDTIRNAYNALCRMLPGSFRDGITVCFQKL